MRAAVRVVTPAAFDTWLGSQPANAAPPVGTPPASAQQAVPSTTSTQAAAPSTAAATSAAAGKTVFTGTAGCSSCHTLAAAGSSGTIGPDLDVRMRTDCASPASKRVRGATLSRCIYTAITKPYAYLPSGYAAGIMPSNFSQSLTSTQIKALVNFLSSVAK